ncbi:MAG: hypothetical protein KDH48_14730 [Rhodoferax sp.]|nr:hypothetical protein [Rhodoferax sp.]
MDVDETRRQPGAGGVDGLVRAGAIELADLGDQAVADRHVGRHRSFPVAVDDDGGPEQQIKHGEAPFQVR